MPEDISAILSRGFDIWKKNTNICTPFILNTLSIMILALVVLSTLLYAKLEPPMPYIESYTATIPPELIPHIVSSMASIMAAVFILLILIVLITSFFAAGAIGMSISAVEKGYTSLRDMVSYGKKNVFRVFLANLIIGAIMLVGFIFMLPGGAAMLSLNVDPSSFSFTSLPQELISAILITVAGVVLWMIYVAIVSIVFAVTSYAIVIDNVGPVEGIQRALNFFLKHRFEVFIVWLIMISLYVGLYLLSALEMYIPYVGATLIMLNLAACIVIVEPLSVVWWTCLYQEYKTSSGSSPTLG